MSRFTTPKRTEEGLYVIRCSPDCPFEDCVVDLTDKPPQQNQGGNNNGSGNTSDNNSNSDARDDGAQSQQQAQGGGAQNQSDQGGSQGSPQSEQGDNQSGQGGQQPNSQGQNDSQQSSSQSSQGNSQQGQGPQGAPQQPQSNQGQRQEQEQKQESEREKREREKREEEQRQRQKELEKLKKELDKYKPKFDYTQELPDNFVSKGGGRQAGSDGPPVQKLGRNSGRLEVMTDRVFYARLKSIMKDNAYDRLIKGRRRGKLDMRSLYKVPAQADNVFMLKEARKNRRYNIVMLVDQSGSMYSPYESKELDRLYGMLQDGQMTHIEFRKKQQSLTRYIDIAADVASFLAIALDKVGIKYGVIGYSHNFETHKRLEEVATDDRAKKLKYDLKHTGGGGTHLVKPLEEAFKSLKGREGQNLVICISDGAPANMEGVRHIVKHNKHVAEFIDIGIGHPPVMEDGFRIENIEELKPLITRELKKRVKRG